MQKKITLLLHLLQLPPSHPNADTLARSGEDEVSRGKRMGYNGS